ncbi:DUF934 domain-containing protein [Acidocella sp.]|uniref:DUF934 domain-containing protein n=1 Tax=Acidocella sp. TaxID=50710 RepID=UPI002606B4E6|nr:DUF934 domain-containing protein [Acidocella sp.]
MLLIDENAREIAPQEGETLRLTPADNPQDLAGALAKVARVEIEFPKFRDGLGFSQARVLRERLGFGGDIRAVGHFIPDQFRFLRDCGFTSFVLPEGRTAAQFAAVLGGRQSGQLLRRHLERAREA